MMLNWPKLAGFTQDISTPVFFSISVCMFTGPKSHYVFTYHICTDTFSNN